MRLKKLIADFPIYIYRGSGEVEITGLCNHSKLVAPGNLFIARKGTADHGAKYIEEAISSGAAAVLTDMPNPFIKGVTQLVHPEPHKIEAQLATRYYGYPSHALYKVGVTGTNGKTTTTFLVKHLFDQLGFSCGLIGTIEYIIGSHRFAAALTTPDAIGCQKFFREMVKQGCSAVAMEVSSQGLAQGRCDEIAFDSAIFTNLSQDHLDYHGTMDAYAQEKAKLFSSLSSDKVAIVNGESPWSRLMVKECKAAVVTYGFSDTFDLYADEIYLNPRMTGFTVHYRGEKGRFEWPMIGRYNIMNCLAAIAVCLNRNIPLGELPRLVGSFASVPGRLEKVENSRNFNVYVDYAHTPDALEKVLNCLKEIKQGKIITIFGCGGDRDRGKRPKMGKAAEEGSDYTIVTSDNPRSEDPGAICSEIAAGFTSSNFTVMVDRRQAIEKALAMATSKDLILIAGKGHETYQLFAHHSIPFDDKKVAQELADNIR
jgi:UDP-N-acetylmuramoyl-L-alanyl-D-glutamate--2,6-diaminopimelate ligase